MNQRSPDRFLSDDIRAVNPSMIGNGAVLSISAAIALHCGHMDVGLADFHRLSEPLTAGNAVEEYFYCSGESVNIACPVGVMDIRIKKGARLCSDLTSDDARCFIGSYLYENSDGKRFLVFNCNGEDSITGKRLELIAENERWLAGE